MPLFVLLVDISGLRRSSKSLLLFLPSNFGIVLNLLDFFVFPLLPGDIQFGLLFLQYFRKPILKRFDTFVHHQNSTIVGNSWSKGTSLRIEILVDQADIVTVADYSLICDRALKFPEKFRVKIAIILSLWLI